MPAMATPDQNLDLVLRQALEDTGVPGFSAVVTRGDEVVHVGGYGDGVTERTPMRVASVSKSFTAAAVMALVDDGKVELDGSVVAQLPGFVMEDERASRITVRQLLNQTSGLADFTMDVSALEQAASLEEFVAGLRGASLASDPGVRYRYCNANYDVAARLVEVASGRSYSEFLRERVFGPLGMGDSRVGGEVPDGFNSAFGVWVQREELPAFRGGSGDVVTTAADMGKWLISQNGRGRQVVSASALEVMHSPSAVAEYGMGWAPDGDGLLIHSGNLFTYTAVEAISPRTGYGYAVLVNSASLHDAAYGVLQALVAATEGREPVSAGGGRQTTELVLGIVGLLAALLGVFGVVRAGKWARKRAGRAWWRVVVRLVPGVVPVVVLAAYPDLVSVLMNGRTVTWAQMTYFPLPLTVVVVVAALAGGATVGARVWRLWLLR
ncbi:CubicO group peptidase (beta-lactamase class C family) [Saccharothrix variisporea]|uniref:CubicO group peptidase (Beta-lactamase class C family) n=2 Tax=Saccharothrix variisporea TaxID=543527 RepID=A0A495XCU0_9PSEU|nr:CubicO group peptidase (beta-lactamase class C family) [Saccharothrix variisporea]